MALGGTLETLTTPVVVENGFGGTDTLTHRAFGVTLDPFSPMAAMVGPSNAAQVTMYIGKPVGGQTFKMYPGIPSETCTFTAQELKDLNAAGKYTLQGLVEAAKVKLGVT